MLKRVCDCEQKFLHENKQLEQPVLNFLDIKFLISVKRVLETNNNV